MVKRHELENALKIAIDDEAVKESNITLQEMDAIKERFDGLFDTLRDEAEDAGIEDEDADVEDEDEDADTPDEP